VTYGLIAATAWAASTVAAANAARRLGTYYAVLTSQVLGLATLGLLTAMLHPSLAAAGRVLAGLAAAGVLGLLGWLFYYRALESGPVGLVSAIGASYGGVTALLAVTLLGEHIGGFGGAGVMLAVGGVALAVARAPKPDAAPAEIDASAQDRGPRHSVARTETPRTGLLRQGTTLALASALTYGVGAFLLGRYSGGAGWLPSTLVAYAASVFSLVLVLPFARPPVKTGGGLVGLLWAVGAGLTEVVALLAFSRGGQVGQVAITAAVSSLYPALALGAGIVMFRERLSGQQLIGVGCIATGVVMLSLT
jgi:drug/metabolite transporter (DMT)-like permease